MDFIKKATKQGKIIGLIIIVGFAFLLRSRTFLSHDFYFLLDQARDMLLVKGIVSDHKLTLIGGRTGFGGLFHGPLWIYMLIPTFIVSHGDPFFTLVPIFLLVSLATVVVGYYVGEQLYGALIGFIFAIFLSLSSPLVTTVPFSTNAQVLPLVVLLYIYSTILYMRGKNNYFILSLFFVGLGFQFESAFAFLLIPLTFVAVILRWKLPNRKILLTSLGAFIVPLLTFILFDLRHQFLMTKSFIRLFSVHMKPLPGYEKYGNFGFRVMDRLDNLFNSILSPLFSVNIFAELLLIFIFVLSIFLILKNSVILKKLDQFSKEYLFILLSPIIIFGIYVFYPLPLWPHYVIPISIFATFFLVISCKKILEVKVAKYLIYLLIIIAIIPALQWIHINYSQGSQTIDSSDGSYHNQLAVANWVIANSRGKDYGYFEYTPGTLTYDMDYLMWWVNKKNNLRQPGSVKGPITYLIMYSVGAHDTGAYDFWKLHVLHTKGRIIETKTFPSGITVQKLSIDKNEQPVDPNYYQNLIFR